MQILYIVKNHLIAWKPLSARYARPRAKVSLILGLMARTRPKFTTVVCMKWMKHYLQT